MKHVLFASATAAAIFVATAGAQTSAPMSAISTAAELEKQSVRASEEPGTGDLWEFADAAEQAMVNADYEEASDLFEVVLGAANFAKLDSERTHYVLSSAAEVASMQSDFVRAHALYERSSQHRLAGSDDWMGRLNASWFIGDLDDAVNSLALIAEKWPEELEFVSEWAMESLLAHTRSYGAEKELMLLQALFNTNWQTDLGAEPTRMWLRLIELLAEKDAIKSALTVSSRLRDPLAVVTMLSEKRFAPIIAAAPDWFSVEEAMDAGIIEARLAVEANPHLLAPAIDLSEALLRAGRHKEALLVVETHMARSALKSVIGDALKDSMAETVRALTTKALALIALGRYEEAGVELELAANQALPNDRLEDFLAVAQIQACLGLPDAALTTLERVTGLADDSRAYFVRFMAARAYSDANAQNLALSALMDRAGESPAEAQHALLLSGQIDAAADLLIRRLNDPQQRSNALLELQGMREQVWPKAELDWRAQAEPLISREDVRESVAAAGGQVADYAIYRWN